VRGRVALLAGGFALYAVAWAMSNPIWAAPDEPASVAKAYGAASGDLTGSTDAVVPAHMTDPLEIAWYRKALRRFDVPERYVTPRDVPCYAFKPNTGAACDVPAHPRSDRPSVADTQQGTYEPFLYAPAGVALHLATTRDGGVRAARLVTAALAVALLAAAAAVAVAGAPEESAVRTTGLLLATTPMLLFLSATVSTNGVEAAAAVLTWLAALRLAGEPPDALRPRLWAAFGVGGTVLALSRLFDPAYLAVLVVAALLTRRSWPRLRATSYAARVAAGCVAAACLLTAAWDHWAVPKPGWSGSVAASGLRSALRYKSHVGFARQSVGDFGWKDAWLPPWPYQTWGLLLLGLLVAALVRGRRRQRAALALTLLCTYAAYYAITALEFQLGFNFQARFLAALLVGVPLLAAEVVARRAAGGPHPLYAGVVVAVAVLTSAVQVTALVVNEHRYAAGAGSHLRWPWAPGWSPPGGRFVWLVTGGVAAVCVCLGALPRGVTGAATAAGP
jgi:hypothetical protein